MVKKIIVTIMVLSIMVTSVACGGSKDKNTLSQIKEKGKIVLGTSADYPPYEFHKLINGKDEIVGFDVEIAKQIAEDLGVELEIIDMKFEGLLASLVTDDVDFVVAGMVPKPDRAKVVDFSIPYYSGNQRMMVRKDDQDKLKLPEDFKGLKIGVQKSTTQEDIAAEKFTEAEVIALGKITDLVLELANNKIDGIILAEPVAEIYVSKNPGFYIPEVVLGQEDGITVGVNKGNADLLEAINKTLEKLINDGTIDKLIQDATALAETE